MSDTKTERRYPYYYEVLPELINPTAEQIEKGMRIAKGLAQVAVAFKGLRGYHDSKTSLNGAGLLVLPESPIERTVEFQYHLGWNNSTETTASDVPLIVVHFELIEVNDSSSGSPEFTGSTKIKGQGPNFKASYSNSEGYAYMHELYPSIDLSQHNYALLENVQYFLDNDY